MEKPKSQLAKVFIPRKGEIKDIWIPIENEYDKCKGSRCKDTIIFGDFGIDWKLTNTKKDEQPMRKVEGETYDYIWHFDECIDKDEFGGGKNI